MSSEIAIKVENISKCFEIYDRPQDRLLQMLARGRRQYFREFWALRDVSFEVKKGETIGIIGRNGSGKSTLLQIICGTLNPSAGAVTTQGRIAALLELGSGFNPEFTGRENVYLNGAVLGLCQDEIDAKFESIITFADIGDFVDQPVKTYSSGMLVRLAFAVAMHVEPDILIVDEALAVGDELFQRKCFSRIEAIRRNGATVLFVSHSGAQIIELCDRSILLDSGESIFLGSAKEAVTMYQKLLYASPEQRIFIRNELISKASERPEFIDDADTPDAGLNVFGSELGSIAESYDHRIASLSTVAYESLGPVIEIPYILSEEGEVVNQLVRGRRYYYCYRVNFERAASGVRFGMSVKTTTGLSLAGALSSSDMKDAIPSMAAKSVVDVQFGFDCNLNPGIYFMNAGVLGLVNGDEVFLHRLVDIIAFRVKPIDKNIETEMVSLSLEPLVKIYE